MEGHGDSRRLHIFDRRHGRSISIFLQGDRVLVWDRHYDRAKQPVLNPTLRKLAMEVLG